MPLAPQPLALRPDVHAALVGDDVVLLDVAADDYLCLPGLAAAWGDGVAPDGEIAEADLARRLAAAGLAGAGTTSRRVRAPLKPPTVSACDHPSRPLSPFEIAALAAVMGDVLIDYRGRSLAHILRCARRRPGAGASRAEILRLSAAFARAVVWLPLPAKCLVRSFALLRFLQRCGQDAAWCFGVRTWPFAAHCWLQFEEVALDDHADSLRAYTPIHVA